VFALDLASGDELWATWASNEIAGVKGSVAGKDGIIVVATDRCTDRYCYKYRNQTLPLVPGNSIVRGLSAVDGTSVWEYKTTAPVWNMNPLWGPGDSVLFQDFEGRGYSLDLATGTLKWKAGGNFGTTTQAGAVYDPGHNIMYTLGMVHYSVNNYHMDYALGVPTGKYCNPYPAPGILVNCGPWPGTRGFVRAYNASSGLQKWELETPEPPASAATGMVTVQMHTRLIVTMGYNCGFNSPSQIWSVDPGSGHIRWMKDGPTLWTSHCAGDKEGSDIRRAMGGRAKCSPNSWSTPVMDAAGDVYVGNQVGVLQRWGSQGGVPGARNVELLSTLTTGVAFQDAAIAFADGVMAVSTCTSLLVFQTYADKFASDFSVSHDDYSASPGMVHGDEVSHNISETPHVTPTGPPGSGLSPWDVR
jgi:outer membrane protein assembly factor BamB